MKNIIDLCKIIPSYKAPRKLLRAEALTLIGKSWKTHPIIFPKFQFSGGDSDRFLKKSSNLFSKRRFSGDDQGRIVENLSIFGNWLG